MNVSCRVSVRPSGAGMGNIHFRIYMLALNISCQHLGDECKLEGFCAPFGRRVGEYTFLNIMLVLNISFQHLELLGRDQLKKSTCIMPTLGG